MRGWSSKSCGSRHLNAYVCGHSVPRKVALSWTWSDMLHSNAFGIDIRFIYRPENKASSCKVVFSITSILVEVVRNKSQYIKYFIGSKRNASMHISVCFRFIFGLHKMFILNGFMVYCIFHEPHMTDRKKYDLIFIYLASVGMLVHLCVSLLSQTLSLVV